MISCPRPHSPASRVEHQVSIVLHSQDIGAARPARTRRPTRPAGGVIEHQVAVRLQGQRGCRGLRPGSPKRPSGSVDHEVTVALHERLVCPVHRPQDTPGPALGRRTHRRGVALATPDRAAGRGQCQDASSQTQLIGAPGTRRPGRPQRVTRAVVEHQVAVRLDRQDRAGALSSARPERTPPVIDHHVPVALHDRAEPAIGDCRYCPVERVAGARTELPRSAAAGGGGGLAATRGFHQFDRRPSW